MGLQNLFTWGEHQLSQHPTVCWFLIQQNLYEFRTFGSAHGVQFVCSRMFLRLLARHVRVDRARHRSRRSPTGLCRPAHPPGTPARRAKWTWWMSRSATEMDSETCPSTRHSNPGNPHAKKKYKNTSRMHPWPFCRLFSVIGLPHSGPRTTLFPAPPHDRLD